MASDLEQEGELLADLQAVLVRVLAKSTVCGETDFGTKHVRALVRAIEVVGDSRAAASDREVHKQARANRKPREKAAP